MTADRYVATHTPSGRPVDHGTYGAYVNHDCRCEACTEANRVAVAAYRARVRQPEGDTVTNKPKAKGTAAETAVLRYLHDLGWEDAYRPAQAGYQDRGDIIIPSLGCVVEVKNRKDYAAGVREGLPQLAAEMASAGLPIGVLVSKVRGRGLGSVDEWHATRLVKDDPIIGRP